MNINEHLLFDTDMLIHGRSIDSAVADAAKKWWSEKAPTGISAFSRVEFKGNYIQDMILLQRKIADSEDLKNCTARVQNSGGRSAFLMLAQLALILDEADIPLKPWARAQGPLLAVLDAQIRFAWDDITFHVGLILDEFQCTRAREAPERKAAGWFARIPECTAHNTNCSVAKFISDRSHLLEQLLTVLEKLPADGKTDELARIEDRIRKTLVSGFDWQGRTCRQVGDLLIALQSVSARGLASSNHKEHRVLSVGLGYPLEVFPVAQIRSK